MQSAGFLAAEIAKFYATVQKTFPAPPLRHNIILTIQGPNLLHTLPAIASLLKTKMPCSGSFSPQDCNFIISNSVTCRQEGASSCGEKRSSETTSLDKER